MAFDIDEYLASGAPKESKEPKEVKESKLSKEGFDIDAYLAGAAPEKDSETSTLEALGHGVLRGALPAAAGIVSGGAGAVLGAPAGPAGAIAGGLGLGFAGSAAAAAAQEEFLKAHPELAKALGLDEESAAKEAKAHPYASMAGELAPNLLAFRPSAALLRSGKGLTEEAAKALTAQKVAAGANAALGAGVGAGVQAGQEAMGDEPIDWTKVGIAGLAGTLGQKETALGRGLTRIGEAPASAASKAAVSALRRPGEVVPEVVPEATIEAVKSAPEAIETMPVSQSMDKEAMLAAVEGRPVAETVSPEAIAPKEIVPESTKVEPTPEVKVPTIGEQVQSELKDLYRQNKALASEKDDLNVWLRKVGINTKDRADMGIPKNSKDYPHVFRNEAQRLDVLMHDAIEGGIISEADLARFPDPVEGFRQLAKDAIDGNFAATPKNMETQAKLQAIQDRIDHLESIPKEQYGLKAETPEESNIRMQKESAAKKAQEDAAIQADMDAQAERDRAEIARRSKEQADNFGLGQTPEESLTGQQRLSGQDDDIPFFSMERPNERPYTRQIANAERVLNEKIDELKRLNTSRAAIKNRFETERTKPTDQFFAKQLREKAKNIEDEIDNLKWETRNNSAEKFLKRATDALSDNEINRDVYDVIHDIYVKEPNLLEGLKLQVRQGADKTGVQSFEAAGEYLGRIVRLYKGTSGAEDPSVVRHELTHSLEQVMPKDAKKKLVQEWRNSIDKAAAKEKTPEGKQFFNALLEHLKIPSVESFKAVSQMMPKGKKDYYYQFMSPSEYWAVNAEKLLKAHLGGAWEKFKKFVNGIYQSLKNTFGFDNTSLIHKTFDDVLHGKREGTTMLADLQRGVTPKYSMEEVAKKPVTAKNIYGQTIGSNWEVKPNTWFQENVIRRFQDKHIDLKRTVAEIKKNFGEIADNFNPYQKEGLWRSKAANEFKMFDEKELSPLSKKIDKLKLSTKEVSDYLHNRHAERRNEQMNKVNEITDENGNIIPWELQDRGSGIATEDARKYLKNLPKDKKAALEAVADDIYKIIKDTQEMLVKSGDKTQEDIDAWRRTYGDEYVPFLRDLEEEFMGSFSGQVAGKSVFDKRAMGSEKNVLDIVNSVIRQREIAIEKVAKNEVDRALYGMTIKYPNPELYLAVSPKAIKNPELLARELDALGMEGKDAVGMMLERQTRTIDPLTGKVKYKTNPMDRYAANALPIRINGEDSYIFFSKKNPVSANMVKSLRGLDTPDIGLFSQQVGKLTQWMAKVNTQWNPVFGPLNFMRDLGAAMANLSNTALKGMQTQVAAGVKPSFSTIMKVMRAERTGKILTPEQIAALPEDDWTRLYYEMRANGGQTLIREQLSRRANQENVINEKIKNMHSNAAKKAASGFFNYLSDFNDSLENAIRLSAFKVAKIDKGLSMDKAITIAKELTVNFDRKGVLGQQVNNYFAFFNASAQGTARMAQTLAGPAGKKIIMGGLGLGALQAGMMEMAGFDENDPQEFVKSRNFIVPTLDGKYIAIPYPLGLHFLPNIGRLVVETGLHGEPGKHAADMAAVVADAFNPLGGGNLSLQTITPTVLDPAVALATNKDAFGRPIAKLDRATSPTTGLSRSREQSTEINKAVAQAINYITGGTEDTKGFLSPTADQLDYLVGQATGGAGREVMKIGKTATAVASGDTENLPSYQVPLFGRFYGDTQSPAANSQHFYDNVTRMAEYEATIKGMRERKENVADFLRDNPEARLWQQANNMENQISQINKQQKKMRESGKSDEQIKALDDRKQAIMTRFNDKVKSLKD